MHDHTLNRYAICPLCHTPVWYRLDGSVLESVYLDGWHHKICLDDYFKRGRVADQLAQQAEWDEEYK